MTVDEPNDRTQATKLSPLLETHGDAPTRPLVSVVVATYNMAQFVAAAVQSALDQTHEQVEVLVVDDGSTDGTRSVLEPLLRDPRVSLFSQQNKGQAAAKNAGIRAARGRYIAFLDADDLWERDKLEGQLPLFERPSSPGVVYARMSYIDEQGRPLGINSETLCRGRVSGELLIRNFIGFGTAVVRRECFERLGVFDERLRMAIDYDLWLRLSTEYAFEYVDRPLLRYRVWSGQMSNNCVGRYVAGIEIMQAFLERFPELVDARTRNEAWAYTYAGFADCLRKAGRGRRSALAMLVRALRYKPAYLPAWRGAVRTLLK